MLKQKHLNDDLIVLEGVVLCSKNRIKSKMESLCKEHEFPLAIKIDTIKVGGLFSSRELDCLILSHPDHRDDYYKLVVILDAAQAMVASTGTSKQMKKQAIADANKEWRKGRSTSEKVGNMIGGAIWAIGKSKSKLEQEQTYYEALLDLVHVALSPLDRYEEHSEQSIEREFVADANESNRGALVSGTNPNRRIALIVAAIAIGIVAFVFSASLDDDGADSRPNSPVVNEEAVKAAAKEDLPQTESATANPSGAQMTSIDETYILPDSDSRYYTESELNEMSLDELYYARNEIYARHGRGFKNADLSAYFHEQSWYEERYTPEDFDSMESPLNDYERKNADLMLKVEKDRNSSHLN